MEIGWDILSWSLIIIGHLGLWCSIYNCVHATAWTRTQRKLSEKVIFLIILLPMVWVLTILIGKWTTSLNAIYLVSKFAYGYGILCFAGSSLFVLRWGFRILTDRLPSAVIKQSTELIDIEKKVGTSLLHGVKSNLLGALPFNQIQKLAVERKTFALARCPKSLQGLRICQLSDLHFTGDIAPQFFEEVIRQANAFEPDLVMITGDIIDKLECLDWIDSILGMLRARVGIFYVLGNHDLRIRNEEILRSKMADRGIVAVNGEWHSIPIKDAVIQLSGNELPWYTGAEDLPIDPPGTNAAPESTLKILLSHSPDQINWARKYDFDLILAGHTHGGQIRFPMIGPIVAPSYYGVKYCAGTFQIGGMLMHVSRGISADDPIRINCPPELGLFTIRACHKTKMYHDIS